MHSLTDNHQSIAWYIRRCLETVSGQSDDKRVQAAVFNHAVTKLVFKLPAFLFNAGYTDAVIPTGDIGVQQHKDTVEITIHNVGTFTFDIKGNKVHAVAGKEEQLQKAADITPGIKRDTGFSNIQPEQAINEVKEHWLKHKHLVQRTSGQYETNKGVYMMENDI
jgi:hypothetical protein